MAGERSRVAGWNLHWITNHVSGIMINTNGMA